MRAKNVAPSRREDKKEFKKFFFIDFVFDFCFFCKPTLASEEKNNETPKFLGVSK
jgi:hypothetical protein